MEIQPERIVLAGEVLADDVRRRIADAWTIEPRRLVIRVVLRPGGSPQTLSRIAAGICAALADAGAIAPPIDVEAVAEIGREPGGAKLKLVKSV